MEGAGTKPPACDAHRPLRVEAGADGIAAVLTAGLERAGRLEAVLELRLRVVRQRVLQATVEVANLDECVLGTHLGLDLGRRPHKLALGNVLVHEVIEFLLRALGGSLRELTRVDANNERIILRRRGDEGLVIRGVVQDEITSTARLDDRVRDRDGVNAVAVGTLVRAAVLGASDEELDDTQLVFCVGRRLTEGVVARLSHWSFGERSRGVLSFR